MAGCSLTDGDDCCLSDVDDDDGSGDLNYYDDGYNDYCGGGDCYYDGGCY